MKASKTLSVVINLNLQDVFGVHSHTNPNSHNIRAETWGTWFESWGETLKDYLPRASEYELTLRLTDDAEIQGLNAQYRHKNQPTDVLAFATLEWDFPIIPDEQNSLEPVYLGDVVISVETATQQAQQQGHSLGRELPWLASHGFLHLLGWDHQDDESLEAMLQQQEKLLKNVGL